MNISNFLSVFTLLWILDSVNSLKCYSCFSNMEGCGKELNIRLNRQQDCASTGTGGGENFCVKVIHKQGSEEFYTRECLMTLREHTYHRNKIPSVQRHGYCNPARNDDPNYPYSETMTYCFCNDYNGCNSGSVTKMSAFLALTFALIAVVMKFLQ